MNMIVMVDKKGGIAKNGDQPIHIPKDLKRFKTLTKGHTIIMGRKTAEVLKRPLPDRLNCVLTTNPKMVNELNVSFLPITMDMVIKGYEDDPLFNHAFVIGGASVYEQLLPYCKSIYVTQVDCDFECDQFFPEISKKEFPTRMTDISDPMIYVTDQGREISYRYIKYRRKFVRE